MILCNGKGSYSIRFGIMDRNSRGYISSSYSINISPPMQILQPKPIGWKWSKRLQTLQPIRGGTSSKTSQHRQLQELLFISKIQQQNLQHTTLHQQKGTATKSPK
ncbi:hypothetical protein Nepgr_003882 [Nepenthes gracilis]|uniref:Uncharacterized protein n=1 Tax=Nepenthes gracilis TaxID=150966 RepID=A0AAD3S0G0_NEPGR|nr:hypothetical protein Nepgr_003882 [Nepenthes gracilis]